MTARFEAGARRALGWLAANVHEFNPAGERESPNKLRSKALVELALLAAYRKKLDPAPLGEDYERIVSHVWDYACAPEYWQTCVRDPRALLLYGLTYAGLRVCGLEVPGFRTAIANVLASGSALAQERIPYRRLDLLHFLELSGFPAAVEYEAVCEHTLLCSNPSVVDLSDGDVYAITHALFYLTDFGLRRGRFCGRFERAEAIELVEQLLSIYIEKENPDIAGELVCSLYCLRAPESEVLDRAWDYLLTAQKEDGHVPGPQHIVPESEGVWKSAYHTTIVFLLADLMRRRAEVEPVNGIVRTIEVPESALEAAGNWLASHLPLADMENARRIAAALAAIGRRDNARGVEIAAGLAEGPEEPPEDIRRLVLSGTALLECIAEYRLAEAAMRLRVRPADRLARDGVRWLLGQQREDGSFGYPCVSPEDGPTKLNWTVAAVLALAARRKTRSAAA